MEGLSYFPLIIVCLYFLDILICVFDYLGLRISDEVARCVVYQRDCLTWTNGEEVAFVNLYVFFIHIFLFIFSFCVFYRTQVSLVRSMGLVLSNSATCANLTDVTLADEDTDSILTDNANKAIQGNVEM